jgi:hypothetical protein
LTASASPTDARDTAEHDFRDALIRDGHSPAEAAMRVSEAYEAAEALHRFKRNELARVTGIHLASLAVIALQDAEGDYDRDEAVEAVSVIAGIWGAGVSTEALRLILAELRVCAALDAAEPMRVAA